MNPGSRMLVAAFFLAALGTSLACAAEAPGQPATPATEDTLSTSHALLANEAPVVGELVGSYLTPTSAPAGREEPTAARAHRPAAKHPQRSSAAQPRARYPIIMGIAY